MDRLCGVQDITEIWETVKAETIKKVRGNKNRESGEDLPMVGQ